MTKCKMCGVHSSEHEMHCHPADIEAYAHEQTKRPSTPLSPPSPGLEDIKLRDIFAATALHGVLTSDSRPAGLSREGMANLSYDLADLMLKARNKESLN